MKIDWKKIAPYIVALVVFIGFAVFYCSPILDGKVVYAGDTMSWKGAANEALEYNATHDEGTWWTNSMFGGMPTFQIAAKITSSITAGWWRSCIQNIMGETIAILVLYFTGFFLMLLCFGVNPWLSIVGGLAIGLSSYFFIIIPAGHITKAFALGALAPIIGGVYEVFRKRYALGIPMVLIFAPYGILLHPQMTYYVGMLIGVMVITEIVMACQAKDWRGLTISFAILIACLGLSYGARYTSIKLNKDYLKETMRGGHSELTKQVKDKPAEGLDIKYATDWSYGKAETLTLLVPNFMGGASGYNVGDKSVLYEELVKARIPKSSAKQFCQSAPTYWGEKMFTSGSVYVGAIICFLFVLGLLIVPGPYKWALLFATLMSIFLAWGKNMMWLTEWFFNYFPMYNKFRAVESILVVAEITMPLLGFMAQQQIWEHREEKSPYKKPVLIAGGITAGICLILALFGGTLFDFTSSYDAQWKGQVGDDIYRMIIDQRVAMMKADAWRSLLFVILGCALTYWFIWQREKDAQPKYSYIFCSCLAVLILADLVPVDKRFFNNDNFVKAKDNEAYFKMQPWEEQILQDKSLDYRVLNLNTNTFNDARTSYRLKSIGGYSAVKLRRYQDLIDEHISKMNWKVINMLNTKYIITRQGVIPNPDALGNAWFVNNVQFVPTPDDESAALNTIDLRTTAVADEQFREVLSCTMQPSAADEIILTEYKPNALTYHATTSADRVAVFSEIYYPEGWHIYVDGKEIRLGRVNYVLRAAVIPAGDHTIVMKFQPGILQWDWICTLLVILTFLISAGCITWPVWRRFYNKSC